MGARDLIVAACLLAGTADPWKYLYGTGLVEYYPSRFIDLTGELVTGFTEQDSEQDLSKPPSDWVHDSTSSARSSTAPISPRFVPNG